MRWLLVAVLGAWAAPATAEPCLSYEPAVSTVTGTLSRETFAGPPNYDDVKSGDQPETGFYLHLRAPLCMRASGYGEATEDVRLVQLILDDAGYKKLSPYLGTLVTLKGFLANATTGHHHAPVLLTPSWSETTTQLLGTFAGPGYRYELTYDRPVVPDRELHPVSLILRGAHGEPLDAAALDDDRSNQYQPDVIDSYYGVADDTQAWTGDTSLGVAARPVQLGPHDLALLVTEKMGSEYPERHHHLYLARHGKLERVWSSDDVLPGGDWDVRVVSAAAPQDLAMFSLDRPDYGRDPDRLRAFRLRWDDTRARMIATALPAPAAPLAILYLGPYRNRERALDAWPHDEACSFGGEILPGAMFPGLGLRGRIIARVFLTRDEAHAAQRELARCPAGHSPRYAEWTLPAVAPRP